MNQPPPDLSRTESELRFMQDLTRRAFRMERLTEFWPVLEEALVSYFGCDRATLYLVEKAELRSMFAKGLSDSVSVSLGDGVAGMVALSRRPAIVNNPRADPRFNPQYDQLSGYRTESIACASFRHEGEAVGVVELLNKPGGFPLDDLDTLETFSRHIGFIIAKLGADDRNRELNARLIRTAKLAALAMLAGGAARELAGALDELESAAERLLMGAAPDSREHAQLDDLKTQAARCRQIARGLEDSMRRTEFPLERVAPARALEDVLALTRHRAGIQKVGFSVAVPDDIPDVRAAPAQLEQVFLNLITNALQAMRAGGTLTISAAREDGNVRFVFADDGEGIDPADLSRVFEPFFSTHGDKKIGAGLGLSVSRDLAGRFGGALEASSEGPGRGAAFTLTLPVYQET